MTPAFRFAPSPNGELHLGHALSALVGFEMARLHGGRFLVRIEDIDVARSREQFVSGILEDLAWLGLEWEQPVLRQSQHLGDYAEAVRRLEAMGVLYPCFASRAEIASAVGPAPAVLNPDGAPIYPGLHKGLPPEEAARRKARGETFALRLDMDRAIARVAEITGGAALSFREMDAGTGELRTVAARPERWGDEIIVRKDAPGSYLLAATFDDARQGITHVTRGEDLLAATDVQRLLQTLLGFPEPIYHHHRPVRDGQGRKLSKSARDTSLAQLRAGGATAEDIRRLVGLA